MAAVAKAGVLPVQRKVENNKGMGKKRKDLSLQWRSIQDLTQKDRYRLSSIIHIIGSKGENCFPARMPTNNVLNMRKRIEISPLENPTQCPTARFQFSVRCDNPLSEGDTLLYSGLEIPRGIITWFGITEEAQNDAIKSGSAPKIEQFRE